jgi:protein phosphatase
MSVRIPCPHCDGPCLVAEQHLGAAVHCPHCKQPFTAPADACHGQLAARAASPRLEVGAATTAGRVRDHNEDSYLLHHVAWAAAEGGEEIALLALADGMGGYEGGREASRLVVQTVAATLAPVLAGALTGQFKASDPETLAENIDYALLEANRAVHRKGQSDPACKGMGATAAVVLAWGGRALIGHVGDCRVYHQRGDGLTQVTKDQTLAARMVELGTLSPKEALTHPARNQVAQAVGRYPDLAPARYEAALTAGDWLIAASDGLHAHLDEAALRAELAKPAATAAELARRLTAAADERGGSDNCTVLCVRCW